MQRREIEDIWTIDRSEWIENVYQSRNGRLYLERHRFDVPGWPPGEAEKYTPLFFECFDRRGWFHGAFAAGAIVGVAILDSKPITGERLQLKFLHVSRAWRGRGLGSRLFELAKAEARRRGATRMYVSATPSEHTVDFYLRLGCVLTTEIDPELFALEPDDIHLDCEVMT